MTVLVLMISIDGIGGQVSVELPLGTLEVVSLLAFNLAWHCIVTLNRCNGRLDPVCAMSSSYAWLLHEVSSAEAQCMELSTHVTYGYCKCVNLTLLKFSQIVIDLVIILHIRQRIFLAS